MAASIPHQYYCSDFSTEFCSFPTCEGISSMFNNNNDYMAQLMNYDINSPVSVTSFPHDLQQFIGVDISEEYSSSVPQMSGIETGFSNFAVCGYQQYDRSVFEPGDDRQCIISGLMPNCFINNCMAAENSGLQGNPITPKVEESEVKVGRYSAEEKKERILRYLKKRNQRNFNKTIKYACRKTLADKRVRVRGRFAKNNDPAYEEEIVTNTSPRTSFQQNNLPFDDSFEMKYDVEDCWLQAAMENLMHLPYNC